MRRFLALLALAIAFGGLAHAEDARDCLARTWKGTIGAAPVTMQLDYIGPDGALAGRYYYRANLVDLLLLGDDTKPGLWKELDPKGTVTGYLTLVCKEDGLSGTWSSPDGSKTLPISAEPQPGDAFSGQRLVGLKPMVTERASIGAHHYELFTARGFESVKGLRLTGESKAVAEINRALMEGFTNRLDEAIDCMAYGRLGRGEDHGYGYASEMTMIAWSSAFVVIGESSEQYCGGIHPLVGEGATTYSLQTAKAEDVSQWLIDEYWNEIPKDSRLGKIILEIYRSDGESARVECIDSMELSGGSVWPTSTGITFRPGAPYVASGCIEDITVPYERLSPYLSVRGKANVQAFQGR